MSSDDEPLPDSFRRGLEGLLDERGRRHSVLHQDIATKKIVDAMEQEIERQVASSTTFHDRVERELGRTLRGLALFRERHPEMAAALDRALAEAVDET